MDATPQPGQPEAIDATRRRRILYVAAGVAAVIVAGAGLVVALTGGDDSPRASSAGSTTSLDPAAVSTTTGKAKTSTSAANHSSTTRGGIASASTSVPNNASTPATPGAGGSPTLPSTTPSQPRPPQTPPTTTQQERDVDRAYVQAYTDECKSIWSIAGPDGVLVDIDDPAKRPFLLDDCTSLMDTSEEWYIDNPDDARAQGQQDAYFNLDEVMWGRRLRNTAGTKTWTSPISGGG